MKWLITGWKNYQMKWLKNKFVALIISLYNVEKNALGQEMKDLSHDVGNEQSVKQNQLAQDLLQGRITQEVKDLRWRTYKILEHVQTKDFTLQYDEHGNATKATSKNKNYHEKLKKIKVDPTLPHKLELVIDNTPTKTQGYTDINTDSDVMSESEHTTYIKPNSKIKFIRSSVPRFKLEYYVKKLHIYGISDTEKLLEFHVSKYAVTEDRTQRMFIKEMEIATKNPRNITTLELEAIEFNTYKDIAVSDSRYFKFDNLKLQPIIEFDGDFLIRYTSNINAWSVSTIEKYREKELDAKYENNERKGDYNMDIDWESAVFSFSNYLPLEI